MPNASNRQRLVRECIYWRKRLLRGPSDPVISHLNHWGNLRGEAGQNAANRRDKYSLGNCTGKVSRANPIRLENQGLGLPYVGVIENIEEFALEPYGEEKAWKTAQVAVDEQNRRLRREGRLELLSAWRQIATATGDLWCPDCKKRSEWDDSVGGRCCPKCNLILAKARMPRGALCCATVNSMAAV